MSEPPPASAVLKIKEIMEIISFLPFVWVGHCIRCNADQIAYFDEGVYPEWESHQIECQECSELNAKGVIIFTAN